MSQTATASKDHGLPRNVFLQPRVQAIVQPYLDEMVEKSAKHIITSRRLSLERSKAQRARRNTKVQPSQQGTRE